MALGEYSSLFDKAVKSPLWILLLPFAAVWYIVNRLRRLLYDKAILKPKKVDIPVISVGNLTLGGSGKTPFVELLAWGLSTAGYVPAIISRGYGGTEQGPLLVRLPGGEIMADAKAVGDEPIMLATHLEDAVIVIGSDRYSAAQLAVKKTDAKVIVLDDGMQHYQLHRDLEFVLVDTSKPPTFVFPAGHLREGPSELRRADIIVLTKTDRGQHLKKWEAAIRKYAKSVPTVYMRYAPGYLRLFNSEERVPLDTIAGSRVAPIAGIADYAGFIATLEELGAIIAVRRDYGDHHNFTRQELVNITKTASAATCECIIITAKDEAKLGDWKPHSTVYVLEIEIELLSGGQHIEEALHRLLKTGKY